MKQIIVLFATFIILTASLKCPAKKHLKLTAACLREDSNKPLCYREQCVVCHAGHYKCFSKNKKKCCKYCPMAKNCPGEKDLNIQELPDDDEYGYDSETYDLSDYGNLSYYEPSQETTTEASSYMYEDSYGHDDSHGYESYTFYDSGYGYQPDYGSSDETTTEAPSYENPWGYDNYSLYNDSYESYYDPWISVPDKPNDQEKPPQNNDEYSVSDDDIEAWYAQHWYDNQ